MVNQHDAEPFASNVERPNNLEFRFQNGVELNYRQNMMGLYIVDLLHFPIPKLIRAMQHNGILHT